MAYMEGPFDWIPSLNIQYLLGVDGISVPMLGLTGLLSLHLDRRVVRHSESGQRIFRLLPAA